MKSWLIGLTLVLSFNALANLKVLTENETVKASDVNFNFSYLQSVLQQKNVSVNFNSFIPGQVINKESLENEFDKIRDLGVSLTPVNFSNKIKSSEINQRFSSAKEALDVYNDLPLSNLMTETVDEDQVLNRPFSYVNLVGTANAIITSLPGSGVVVVSGTSFTYTPNPNFSGLDSFSYKIYDGELYSVPATVSLSVLAVNDSPVMNDLTINTEVGLAHSGSLSGTDIENNSLTYELVTNGQKGIVNLSNNGTFTYTPSNNSFGLDSFVVKAFDGDKYSLDKNILVNINTTRNCSADGGSGTQIFNTSTLTWNSCILTSCPAGKITSTNQLECVYINATGGTVSTVGNYKIHKFTTVGAGQAFALTSGKTTEYEVLVVAGGGGAGSSLWSHGGAGGGGAGGLVHNTNLTIPVGNHTVTVGNGGNGATANACGRGANGGNSSIGAILSSIGGGAGGSGCNGGSPIGSTGGSGGGGGFTNYGVNNSGGAGTSGQGSSGGRAVGTGSGSNGTAGGGGGGGAGGVGNNSYVLHNGGLGGSGLSKSISGASVTYSAGGYGGGNHGGGAGSNGAANSGNGANAPYAGNTGGSGGSGVVIIRYLYK